MEPTLREVFGLDDGRINWGRAHMVVLAFVSTALVGPVLVPMVRDGFAVPPAVWPTILAESVALAVLMIAAVRFVRPAPLALVVALLASVAITAALRGPGAGDGPTLAEQFAPVAVAWRMADPLVPLLAMGGLLRLGLGPGLALPLGGAAGSLAVATLWWTASQGARWVDVVAGNVPVATALGLLLWLSLRATGPASPGRVSRPFFVGAISSAFGFAAVVSLAVTAGNVFRAWSPREAAGALPVLGLAMIALAYGVVLTLRFVYRMWSSIQDGHARTSPGRAVGLLFVPLFNLYWAFVVFAGFARDYEAYRNRHGIDGPPLSTGLFRAYPILALAAAVPVVGLPFALAALVTLGFVVHRAADAVNALPAAASGPAAAVPLTTP